MNDTPKYRSFRKAYGGDPDSAVLNDLHKRVMRLEIDLHNALALIRRLEDRPQITVSAVPVLKNTAREMEALGGDYTPPPPKD